MMSRNFDEWLSTDRGFNSRTIASRVANCGRVEKFCGDLDRLHADGMLDQLIEEFQYSTDDERHGRPQRHAVPINGDIRNGSATLKSALVLYRDFLDSAGSNRPKAVRPPPPPTPKLSAWPQWDEPSEAEALQLARVLAPYVRFLHPEIVRALVDDNESRRPAWCDGLRARGIDPEAYLWLRSPCAFPGVRRYAGSEEIAIYRGHKAAEAGPPPGALRLDDNDFPKHLWSFVLRGRPFQKFGPEGYNLAHLADHKDHQNRAAVDFELAEAADVHGRLSGLYSCPTNTVYVPRSFLKPTDFNGKIRQLLIRRAQDLYGAHCAIVPPIMKIRSGIDSEWDTGNFKWSTPVGDMDHVASFLRFRAERVEELMRGPGSSAEGSHS